MQSKTPQTSLYDFEPEPYALHARYRELIEDADPGSDVALIFPGEDFPNINSGKVHLFSEDSDWSAYFKTADFQFLRFSEVTDQLSQNDAHYIAYTEDGILHALYEIFGEDADPSWVKLLVIKK